MQRPGAALPPHVGQSDAVPAVHRQPSGGQARDADLEAGAEDDAVDLVRAAAGDDRVLGDPLHAVAVGGVDEGDVGAVERLEVAVAERGPLAHVAVPGLEEFRGRRVGDDGVDPRPDLVHLPEVGQLVGAFAFLGRYRGVAVAGDEFLLEACGAGPAVVDQVLVHVAAGDEGEEVVAAAPLPAGGQGRGPLRVGGAVAADVDRGGRALEDVQLLGVGAEMGDALDGGGARADQGDAFVGEAVEIPVGVAAGVRVVPAAGVEGAPAERLDARYPGEFRLAEGAAGGHHVPRAYPVAAVGGDEPLGRALVPAQLGDLRPEAGVAVEVEGAADRPRVLPDLLAGRVPPLRDVVQLFQQRQVDVRLDVAVDARVAVPVPGAAEVAALLDHPDRRHARLPQPGTGEQPAEPAAEDHHLDAVVQRFTGELPVGVRVFVVVAELAGDLLILPAARRPDAAVPLGAVAGTEGFQVDVGLRAAGRNGRAVGVGHGVPLPLRGPCRDAGAVRTGRRQGVGAVRATRAGRRGIRDAAGGARRCASCTHYASRT